LRERETLKENLARIVGDQAAGKLALRRIPVYGT
jgi:hypothetical protein